MLPLDVTDQMLKAPKNPLTDLVPVWTSYWQLIETFAALVFGWVVGVDVTVAERTDQQCACRSGGSLRNWWWRWCGNILRARGCHYGSCRRWCRSRGVGVRGSRHGRAFGLARNHWRRCSSGLGLGSCGGAGAAAHFGSLGIGERLAGRCRVGFLRFLMAGGFLLLV